MKPDFALLLSFDGIALLRRAEGGPAGHWFKLGDVSPETSDLPKALAALRESAADLAGDPADVKLVLPTEQVRFLDIPAPAPGSSVAEAVESALDGATPYAIDDLVYDHEQRDGRVHVAAVARETLEEAESFATAHGFHPLAFVSDTGPDAGFSREPFFGPTETALTSLTPGVRIEGDPTPITVVPRPAPAEKVSAPKEPPAAEVAAAPAPNPVPAAEATPAPKSDTRPASAPTPGEAPGPATEAAAKPAPKPAPSKPVAEAKPAPEPAPKPQSDPASKTEAAPAAESKPASEPAAKPAAKPAAAPVPVAETKPDPTPAAQPASKAAAKTAAPRNAAPEPAPKPAPKASATPDPNPAPEADSAPAAKAAAKSATGPTAKPAPKAEVPPTSQPAPKPQPKAKARPPAQSEAHPAPPAKAAAPKPGTASATPKPQPPKPEPAGKTPAKAATANPAAAAKTPAPKPPAPKAPAPKTPAAEPSAAPSFASIRAHRDAPAPRPGTNISAVPGDMPGRRDAPAPTAPKTRDASEDLAAKARASFSMRPKARPDAPAPAEDAAAIAASTAVPEATATPLGFASRRKPRKPEAKPEAAADIRKPALGKARTAAVGDSAVMDEGERMTVFGARGQQKVGGKPRFLGLILTVVLLLAMLAAAAMASIFLDEGLAGFFRRTPASAETEIAAAANPATEGATAAPGATAETPPAVVEPLPEAALALPDRDSNADPQDPGAINLAALNAGVPAMSRELVEDQVDGLSVPFETEALTPEQAEARYAATGIWQRAPLPPAEPGHNLVGDVYVASIDPSVAVGDAVAIPTSREAQTDLLPPAQINPYPADAGLTFDDNGLILPTPEGARHPAGFLLIKGPPPLKPPLRPGTERPVEAAQPVPESDADLDADAALPAEESAPEAPATSLATVVDETLAGLRPRPRPGDLEEQNERANLGGVSLAELRQKRPRPRPERAAEAEEARPAAAASLVQESLAANAEAAEDAAEIDASALAVAASPQPKTRPANIAALVTRATRNAEAESAARQTAAVQPRTVQPNIPSRSSVAAAATQENAINLRKVNLIGVYGKPSSRRALVRLANGRYQKVKVGDRIDGGRVSAISDGQLSYVKSGRNIVLRMPRG